MKRNIFIYALFVCVLWAGATAILGAQQASQPGPYAGTSNPPPDDTITTPEPQPAPVAKPSPSHPMYAQPAAPQPTQQNAQPTPRSLDGSLYSIPASQVPANNIPANGADGTDHGIVQVAPDASAPPALNPRAARFDSARNDSAN